MQESPVYVSLEFTPNPNTLKYAVNRKLIDRGALTVTTKAEAKEKSPLADLLLEFGGISSVMIGRDFVTITKSDDGDWESVHKNASHTITTFLTEGKQAVTAELSSGHKEGKTSSAAETKIKEVLDQEIRPAVAQDGGDITFDRFEDGIVYLYMQGSCSGCPSSTMTLKMGIEQRLKAILPEIREVVAI